MAQVDKIQVACTAHARKCEISSKIGAIQNANDCICTGSRVPIKRFFEIEAITFIVLLRERRTIDMEILVGKR